MDRNLQSRGHNKCAILYIMKSVLFVIIAVFVLYLPLGDPVVHCSSSTTPIKKSKAVCFLCYLHKLMLEMTLQTIDALELFGNLMCDAMYEAKLGFYGLLEKFDKHDLCRSCCRDKVINSLEEAKEELDNVIEDEITHKLSEDLLQSIERKFQVDLERSVDMVLVKIKMLLQNGTAHIQDKLMDLQSLLDVIRSQKEKEVDACLTERQNETSALAEKTLHQMVVCGYALIGHDPAQAVTRVMKLKSMIKQGLTPIYEQKKEVYSLLKICGHDHESLKKVIKCVISKSPIIKTSMMEITGKLIEGVVDLTKLMAHGAMHEACLMEVIKATEDKAFELVKDVRNCAYGNNETIMRTVDNYIAENNATVLDIKDKRLNKLVNIKNRDENVTNLLRRMSADGHIKDFQTEFNAKMDVVRNQLATLGINYDKLGENIKNNDADNNNIDNNDEGRDDNEDNNENNNVDSNNYYE